MKGEVEWVGGWLGWLGGAGCLYRDGRVVSVLHRTQQRQQQRQQSEDPRASTRVPIMSNFSPLDFPLGAYVQIPFEKGNLMVIVMNVDSTDQNKQEEGDARDPERGLFRCSGVGMIWRLLGGGGVEIEHDYIFFPPLCFFLSYTGEPSATRRQGAPSTRIIRRFFTSDKQAIWLSLGLFEENMFLRRTPGSRIGGGESRSPLST